MWQITHFTKNSPHASEGYIGVLVINHHAAGRLDVWEVPADSTTEANGYSDISKAAEVDAQMDLWDIKDALEARIAKS